MPSIRLECSHFIVYLRQYLKLINLKLINSSKLMFVNLILPFHSDQRTWGHVQAIDAHLCMCSKSEGKKSFFVSLMSYSQWITFKFYPYGTIRILDGLITNIFSIWKFRIRQKKIHWWWILKSSFILVEQSYQNVNVEVLSGAWEKGWRIPFTKKPINS